VRNEIVELSNRKGLANDLTNVLKTSSLDACASKMAECELLAWTRHSRRGSHEPMIVPKQGVYYVVFFETLYDSLEDALSKALMSLPPTRHARTSCIPGAHSS
jgi:hypothetical protein